MSLAALALLLAASPAFRFDAVQPWRWSEGRQEMIPSLSATLHNLSGDDWAEARFRVTVACSQGGTRSYTVLLRDILLGSQTVQATAFDAIGSLEACAGEPSVEFLNGRKYDDASRPSYILLGFSYQEDDGPVSSDLAGILDYRRHSDSGQETHPHFLQDHGRRFTLPAYPGAAFYSFRVEPGVLGLAGFLLKPADPASSPLSRFLRFFPVQPGTVSYLGIFRLRRGPGRLYSVTIDASAGPITLAAPLFPRPVLPAPASKPGATSSLTSAQ
jgi:hypothetical protein